MKHASKFRNVAIAFATVVLLTAGTTSMAAEDPKQTHVELKFLGNFKNKPVFELQFNNPGPENDYVLTIRDQYGNALYRETILTNSLTKKFMLNTDEIEDEVLRLEISSRKDEKLFVYQINRTSHVVEEVKIAKID